MRCSVSLFFFFFTCGPRTVTGVVLCLGDFGHPSCSWGCSTPGARKSAWKNSIGKLEVAKMLPSLSKRKCEDNIKMGPEGVGQERESRLESYVDRDLLRGFVYTVLNPRVWEKLGKPFLVAEPSSASV